MPDGLNSYINMFAGAKLLKQIRSGDCFKELQKNLDKLYMWSQFWKMHFNEKKAMSWKFG